MAYITAKEVRKQVKAREDAAKYGVEDEPHFKVFASGSRWHFTLMDAKGRLVTGSKVGFKTKSECMTAIKVVQETTSGTKVVFIDKELP